MKKLTKQDLNKELWFRGQKIGDLMKTPPSVFRCFHIGCCPEVALDFAGYAEHGEILVFTLQPNIRKFPYTAEVLKTELHYPCLAADLMSLLGDVLVMWDFLKIHINDFDGITDPVAGRAAIDAFIDDAMLDPLEADYPDSDVLDFLDWVAGVKKRWNALPQKYLNNKNHATAITLLIQDIDTLGKYDAINGGDDDDELIIWSPRVMDLMVSGIRPLEANELNEIIQQIERKHYTRITLGEFMDACEKCGRQDIWRSGRA